MKKLYYMIRLKIVGMRIDRNIQKHNKLQINHKDGNKVNNNLQNLEWCSTKENTQHAWRIGLIRKEMFEKVVIQFDLNMDILNIFTSIKGALKHIGENEKSSHISSCCLGKIKTAFGYKWKHLSYIEELVKKATPKKVIVAKGNGYCLNSTTIYHSSGYIEKAKLQFGEKHSDFCPDCGQALDWSD